MPRTIEIEAGTTHYRGYPINQKYAYNKAQLDKIIDWLEFYTAQSKDGNLYRVGAITILQNHKNPPKKTELNITSAFSKVLNYDQYVDRVVYRWSKEYSAPNEYNDKPDIRAAGIHYHLMIIGNYMSNEWLEQNLAKSLRRYLNPDKNNPCWIVNVDPRAGLFIPDRLISLDELPKADSKQYKYYHLPDDADYFHLILLPTYSHLHNLNTQDELSDSVYRFCYRAKLDQKNKKKLGKPTFGGSQEPLKPLIRQNSSVPNVDKQMEKDRHILEWKETEDRIMPELEAEHASRQRGIIVNEHVTIDSVDPTTNSESDIGKPVRVGELKNGYLVRTETGLVSTSDLSDDQLIVFNGTEWVFPEVYEQSPSIPLDIKRKRKADF